MEDALTFLMVGGTFVLFALGILVLSYARKISKS
jgi:hypothetical protein